MYNQLTFSRLRCVGCSCTIEEGDLCKLHAGKDARVWLLLCPQSLLHGGPIIHDL